jgi:dienelactone hydrolase
MKKLTVGMAFLAMALGAHAKLVTKTVAYDHAGVHLEGWLMYDDERTSGGRKLPGVVVVHEWWGLNDYAKSRAEQVARLGYVAIAIDMYGKGVVTNDALKASQLASQFYGQPLMAERAAVGLKELAKTGLVDEKRIVAMGYCFGGTVCQALAYSGAPLMGVVSFHGTLLPAPPEAAAQNKARFLICHGAVDPFVKPAELATWQKSMDDGKFDYQFISYAGAVHAFTNKDADRIAQETGLKGLGYNAVADRRSWNHMKTFLKELFGE